MFTEMVTTYMLVDLSAALNICCMHTTGKTTVAKIYGRILKDLGLLSKGDVVVTVPADFVGAYVGHSEKRTLKLLKQSQGCVLVIDEVRGSGDRLPGACTVCPLSLRGLH